MKKFIDRGGYDLDYYTLFLRNYLNEHHFPEADDDLFITSRADRTYDIFVASRLAGDEYVVATEKAMETLYAGLEMSPYDFVSTILIDEFTDNISLEDESVEFWTYTFLDELKGDFNGVELSEEYLNTPDGIALKLAVIGRISLFFEQYEL